MSWNRSNAVNAPGTANYSYGDSVAQTNATPTGQQTALEQFHLATSAAKFAAMNQQQPQFQQQFQQQQFPHQQQQQYLQQQQQPNQQLQQPFQQPQLQFQQPQLQFQQPQQQFQQQQQQMQQLNAFGSAGFNIQQANQQQPSQQMQSNPYSASWPPVEESTNSSNQGSLASTRTGSVMEPASKSGDPAQVSKTGSRSKKAKQRFRSGQPATEKQSKCPICEEMVSLQNWVTHATSHASVDLEEDVPVKDSSAAHSHNKANVDYYFVQDILKLALENSELPQVFSCEFCDVNGLLFRDMLKHIQKPEHMHAVYRWIVLPSSTGHARYKEHVPTVPIKSRHLKFHFCEVCVKLAGWHQNDIAKHVNGKFHINKIQKLRENHEWAERGHTMRTERTTRPSSEQQQRDLSRSQQGKGQQGQLPPPNNDRRAVKQRSSDPFQVPGSQRSNFDEFPQVRNVSKNVLTEAKRILQSQMPGGNDVGWSNQQGMFMAEGNALMGNPNKGGNRMDMGNQNQGSDSRWGMGHQNQSGNKIVMGNRNQGGVGTTMGNQNQDGNRIDMGNRNQGGNIMDMGNRKQSGDNRMDLGNRNQSGDYRMDMGNRNQSGDNRMDMGNRNQSGDNRMDMGNQNQDGNRMDMGNHNQGGNRMDMGNRNQSGDNRMDMGNRNKSGGNRMDMGNRNQSGDNRMDMGNRNQSSDNRMDLGNRNQSGDNRLDMGNRNQSSDNRWEMGNQNKGGNRMDMNGPQAMYNTAAGDRMNINSQQGMPTGLGSGMTVNNQGGMAHSAGGRLPMGSAGQMGMDSQMDMTNMNNQRQMSMDGRDRQDIHSIQRRQQTEQQQKFQDRRAQGDIVDGHQSLKQHHYRQDDASVGDPRMEMSKTSLPPPIKRYRSPERPSLASFNRNKLQEIVHSIRSTSTVESESRSARSKAAVLAMLKGGNDQKVMERLPGRRRTRSPDLFIVEKSKYSQNQAGPYSPSPRPLSRNRSPPLFLESKLSPERRQLPSPKSHQENRAHSPARRLRSIDSRRRTPERHSRSPNRRGSSLERRGRSPNKRGRTTERRGRSPNRRPRYAGRREISPAERHRSPGRRDKSPLGRRRSPYRRERTPLRSSTDHHTEKRNPLLANATKPKVKRLCPLVLDSSSRESLTRRIETTWQKYYHKYYSCVATNPEIVLELQKEYLRSYKGFFKEDPHFEFYYTKVAKPEDLREALTLRIDRGSPGPDPNELVSSDDFQPTHSSGYKRHHDGWSPDRLKPTKMRRSKSPLWKSPTGQQSPPKNVDTTHAETPSQGDVMPNITETSSHDTPLDTSQERTATGKDSKTPVDFLAKGERLKSKILSILDDQNSGPEKEKAQVTQIAKKLLDSANNLTETRLPPPNKAPKARIQSNVDALMPLPPPEDKVNEEKSRDKTDATVPSPKTPYKPAYNQASTEGVDTLDTGSKGPNDTTGSKGPNDTKSGGLFPEASNTPAEKPKEKLIAKPTTEDRFQAREEMDSHKHTEHEPIITSTTQGFPVERKRIQAGMDTSKSRSVLGRLGPQRKSDFSSSTKESSGNIRSGKGPDRDERRSGRSRNSRETRSDNRKLSFGRTRHSPSRRMTGSSRLNSRLGSTASHSKSSETSISEIFSDPFLGFVHKTLTGIILIGQYQKSMATSTEPDELMRKINVEQADMHARMITDEGHLLIQLARCCVEDPGGIEKTFPAVSADIGPILRNLDTQVVTLIADTPILQHDPTKTY